MGARGRCSRGRTGRRLRTAALPACIAALTLGSAACDDQVKYVFETMTRQPAVQTYEALPALPPEGTVPIGALPHFDLLAADTLLTNPLPPTPATLERGEVLYARFCTMCHGESGAGDGPVVGPNRLPPLPTLNLLSQRANELSDGYLLGMIANGRGVMPSYRRVPWEDRWYLVAYVRSLQSAGREAQQAADRQTQAQ
jgi:mono/diheme cytochrome c family protein